MVFYKISDDTAKQLQDVLKDTEYTLGIIFGTAEEMAEIVLVKRNTEPL